MTDTSFQASLAVIRAIDVDYQHRLKVIQSYYHDEMAPLRSEFRRKCGEVESRRKVRLDKEKRWRDDMVKRAGATPVERAP